MKCYILSNTHSPPCCVDSPFQFWAAGPLIKIWARFCNFVVTYHYEHGRMSRFKTWFCLFEDSIQTEFEAHLHSPSSLPSPWGLEEVDGECSALYQVPVPCLSELPALTAVRL